MNKNKLLLSIITTICMIPAFISATAVRVGKWQRPNGTSIVVVSDVHFSSQKESVQREDFVAHLKGCSASHLLAEDPCELGIPKEYCPSAFIPGIVENVRSESIAAQSIEFRKGRCGLEREKIVAHIDFLLSKCSEIGDHIPEQFRRLFDEISDQLRELKRECPDSKLMPLQEQLEGLELNLTDFVFLSHIVNYSLQDKNIFVCVGGDHADFLGKAFDTLGYTHIKNVGDYNDEDLIEKIDKYALNLQDVLGTLS